MEEVDKVCISHILAVVSYPYLHVISIYSPSFMFLRFRRILFLSTNSLETTIFSLNFIPTQQLLLQGSSKFGLYPWPSSNALSSKSLAVFIGEKVSLDQWHLRLGHPASLIVNQVIQSNKLPVSSSKPSSFCSPRQQGKSHRLHFSSTPSISSNPLQLLFLDVWGPAPQNSVNNKRFYLSVVDDFSKYTWLYPLETKSEVCATFLRFKQLVETYFNTKIIMGGSFVSWVFDGGFLLNLGFYCIMGNYFVSWVLDGAWGVLLGFILLWGYFVSWVFVGGFLLYLRFHVGFGCCGYIISYGFFMWAS
jgi:hypothetical protein